MNAKLTSYNKRAPWLIGLLVNKMSRRRGKFSICQYTSRECLSLYLFLICARLGIRKLSSLAGGEFAWST